MNGLGENRHPHLRLVTDPSPAAGHARLRGERDDPDALVAASVADDRDALRDLVSEHGAVVLAIVRRYARTPEDASDLVYQSFLRAVRAARRTLRRDPERSLAFRRSLLRAAVSAGRTQLRREVQYARARLDHLGPTEPHPPADADATIRAERVARVRSAVLQLSQRQREVLTLALDAQLRVGEIAEVLGITARAARANLRKASLFVRAALSDPAPASSCQEFAVCLPLRALGALERAESARVEAHLAGCQACSAEADGIAEAFGDASLAPPPAAEREALDHVPARVLAAFRRGPGAARVFGAIALAAIFALALGLMRHPELLHRW